MNFKMDENLPMEVVDVLRGHGQEAINVVEQQVGGASDDLIAKVCQGGQQVFVTLDLDFGEHGTCQLVSCAFPISASLPSGRGCNLL